MAVSTLSAFIFLAMMKQATVVGEPAIMRMAIIWLSWKPMAPARGRKMAGLGDAAAFHCCAEVSQLVQAHSVSSQLPVIYCHFSILYKKMFLTT